METGLLHAHSGLRYLVFLFLLIVVVKAIINTATGKEWSKGDSKLTTFLMATTHLQAVIGLVMYFGVYKYYQYMSEMADPIMRWKAVEHITGMLIFVVLVTLLHRANKNPNKANKNRRALIMGLISVAIVLGSIPMDRWF